MSTRFNKPKRAHLWRILRLNTDKQIADDEKRARLQRLARKAKS